jgi:hypothetical protein
MRVFPPRLLFGRCGIRGSRFDCPMWSELYSQKARIVLSILENWFGISLQPRSASSIISRKACITSDLLSERASQSGPYDILSGRASRAGTFDRMSLRAWIPLSTTSALARFLVGGGLFQTVDGDAMFSIWTRGDIPATAGGPV